jgi:hypothetical protein
VLVLQLFALHAFEACIYPSLRFFLCKTDIIDLGTRIIQSKTSVEEKWTELKNGINNTLGLNVPKKLTPNRHNLPWLSIMVRYTWDCVAGFYYAWLVRQEKIKDIIFSTWF